MKVFKKLACGLSKQKCIVGMFGLLVTVVFLKITLIGDGIETFKRTILSQPHKFMDTKPANRSTQCSPFSSIYNKRVQESNQNELFNYEKEFTLKCLERIKDRVWVRTFLPSFRFEPPLFADNQSKYLFHRNSENTIYIRTQPIARFTEVLFLRKGTYVSDKSCGYKGDFDWLIQNKDKQSGTANVRYPVLAPVLSFVGGVFQHFLDGTIHLLVQILPFIQDRSVKILTYPPRDRILFDFMAKLNISKSQIVFYKKGTKYHADLMIFSCIQDRYHPMLWDKVRTKLGVPRNLIIEPHKAFIVIITREGCFNCGRRLLNQDEIIRLLQIRYGNNSIKVFKGPMTLDASIELFSKARIIMGPHGGGMYNMVFAPYGTTVIEFMPTNENGETGRRGHQIFWKMANTLHHFYWRVAQKPLNNSDMKVNLNHLTKLLDLVDKKT